MRRRDLLRGMIGLTLAPRICRASEERRKLAHVDVDPSRVIRTVVGLRPYRPSGFVVRTDSLGDKKVVHNYGHGGAGITLSWGTSALAVEQAWATGARDFAVLGCGAVGLATARLLQNRGGNVTIYARDLPPQTTSNIAGGQWGAAMVSDPEKVTAAWKEQFDRAHALSRRSFQDLLGEEYGVRWLENYSLSDGPFNPEVRVLRGEQTPFPGYYTRPFWTMMIEPARYLHRLMEDVMIFGGQIRVREFADRQSLQQLSQSVILNCTGLGSRELFDDQELTPVKGQLTVLLPQPEIDYAYIAGDHYMFPRADGILLGGTHEAGNFSLEPNERASAEVMEFHRALSQRMR